LEVLQNISASSHHNAAFNIAGKIWWSYTSSCHLANNRTVDDQDNFGFAVLPPQNDYYLVGGVSSNQNPPLTLCLSTGTYSYVWSSDIAFTEQIKKNGIVYQNLSSETWFLDKSSATVNPYTIARLPHCTNPQLNYLRFTSPSDASALTSSMIFMCLTIAACLILL
jgi:hypothetical protein